MPSPIKSIVITTGPCARGLNITAEVTTYSDNVRQFGVQSDAGFKASQFLRELAHWLEAEEKESAQ